MKKIIAFFLLLIPVICTAQSDPLIPVDKQYHIGAGVVTGTWGFFAGNSMEKTPEQCLVWGMISATGAGIGKEMWDWSWRLTGDMSARFDPMDALATMAGGVFGTGLSYLGMKLYNKYKKKEPQDDSLYFYFGTNTVQGGIKLVF